MHKGDQHDPRVALIEVVPDEVRYWLATRGAVGRALEVAVGAVTGRAAAPGEIRTITSDEVRPRAFIPSFLSIGGAVSCMG